MNNLRIYGTSLLIFPFALVSCGDDVSRVKDSYTESNVTIDYGDNLDLVNCDTSCIGKIVFVRDSSATFFCNGKSWTLLKGADGDKGPEGDNGTDGNPGKTGEKGYIHSQAAVGPEGAQGPQGLQGEAGEASDINCQITKDSAGIILFKCGDDRESLLYSALCGDSAYDFHEKFCVQGKLYSTKDNLLDTRDNHIYKIITIGEGDKAATWMSENLNYKTAQSQCYNNVEASCDKYGRLYTWASAMLKDENECGYSFECDVVPPVQGVCPDGWHISTTEEWLNLFEYEKEARTAGAMLMAKTSWTEGIEATDELGFAALAAGYYDGEKYLNNKYEALFWTPDFIDKFKVQTYGMKYDNADVTYDAIIKSFALSVRCVKD